MGLDNFGQTRKPVTGSNKFHKSFFKSLVQRFKIMGDMDISNANIPQDGRIHYLGQAGEIDIRNQSQPTI